MAWRGLHVSNPARLTQRNAQIVVEQEEAEINFPIEDVAWLILDTPQVIVTGSLLSALVENGVALTCCDFGARQDAEITAVPVPSPGAAYHGQIGRETTAVSPILFCAGSSYHGQIGRETTAIAFGSGVMASSYHGQIGRETTSLTSPAY